MPEPLRGSIWYRPTEHGYERTVKERMDWWAGLKKKRRKGERVSAVVRHRRLALPFWASSRGAPPWAAWRQRTLVALKEIRITGIAGRDTRLVFDVFNPNAIACGRPGSRSGSTQGVASRSAVRGPLDLSPTNHTQVVMPVRFEWAGVGAGAKALLRNKRSATA
jgi:hypothetical protein